MSTKPKSWYVAADGTRFPSSSNPEAKRWHAKYKSAVEDAFGGNDVTIREIQVPVERALAGNAVVDKNRFDVYKRMMQAGENIPPIAVKPGPNGTFKTVDGSHRLAVAKELGVTHLPGLLIQPALGKAEPAVQLDEEEAPSAPKIPDFVGAPGATPTTLPKPTIPERKRDNQAVFDSRKGTLITPRGEFKVQIPKDEKYANVLASPDVQKPHQMAMAHWKQLNQLLQQGRLPKGVLTHAAILSGMSANEAVATQELAFSHVQDLMNESFPQFDPAERPMNSDESASLEQKFYSRQPPDYMNEYWTQEGKPRVYSEFERRDPTTGLTVPPGYHNVGNFDTKSNSLQGMHRFMPKLAELLNRHGANGQAVMAEMLRQKAEFERHKNRVRAAMRAGKIKSKDEMPFQGTPVSGFAPKTLRYMGAMLGLGDLHVPDTHFIRHTFGTHGDKKLDEHIKAQLWNPNNAHILSQIDHYMLKHHPAYKMASQQHFGRPDHPQAVFPGFWLHWLTVGPHERARGLATDAANDSTDHRVYWNAIDNVLRQAGLDPEDMGKSEDQVDQLAHKTAWAQKQIESRFGEGAALQFYFEHLLPKLLKAEHTDVDQWTPAHPHHDAKHKMRAVQQQLTDDIRPKAWQGHPNSLAGHSYVAAEALYHLLGGGLGGWEPHVITHEGRNHWFLRSPHDKEVFDPTAGQFEQAVPYDQARPSAFRTKQPSHTAKLVMDGASGSLEKSEMKKAIQDLPAGKLIIENPRNGTQLFDYNDLLTPEHRDAGYQLHLHHHPKLGGVTVQVRKAGGEVGQLTATTGLSPEGGLAVEPQIADIDPKHQRKGLGSVMYEALMSHAIHHLGATHLQGGAHSSLASKVHQKLAAKHGLAYRAEANLGSVAYPDKAAWDSTKSGSYDEKFAPYGYALKSESSHDRAVKHGAVVMILQRPDGHFLMGKRRDSGKWCCPAGHLNAGERPHDGALREIAEETGLIPKMLSHLADVKGGPDGNVPITMFHATLQHHDPTGEYDPDKEFQEFRWVSPFGELPPDISRALHYGPDDLALNRLGMLDPNGGEVQPARDPADSSTTI